MKAVRYHSYGDSGVLVYEDASRPVAGAGQVVVKVAGAAAWPSASVRAWQSLFEYADLKGGQSILVNGAGGAVGGYAVQLAKQAGAVVTATASVRGAGRIRSYGADRVIDYTDIPLLQA